MNSNPILSILIPTKNREEFATKVIHDILGINDDRFQLVIQDNSDTNKLEESLLTCMKDRRLNYYYNNDILSFVENFSLGISKCTGEYVTIIGDDDSVNPNIIEIALWACKNNIEAITPSLPIIYYWPDSGVSSINDIGRLIISDISCQVKYCNTKKEVIKFLKNGCQDYLSYNLAKVYHGMIKRTVLEEIKNRTGKYIGGLSPDIYLSIATSLLVENVLIIDYPLTISGICKKSGSSDSVTGKHTGNLNQAPHFRGHLNYQWSNRVPEFYSVETIWADSALAAIIDLKANNLVKHFRLDILSSKCIKLYPQYKILILENLARNLLISRNSILNYFYLFKGYITNFCRTLSKIFIYRLLHNKSHQVFNSITDIEKASLIINTTLKSKISIITKNLHKVN